MQNEYICLPRKKKRQSFTDFAYCSISESDSGFHALHDATKGTVTKLLAFPST